MDLDTLIGGALVIDGTGRPGRPADIGIRAGRIVAVAEPGALSVDGTAARERIDAGGHVLSPGFIDIHTHSDLTLLDDPGADSKVQQGVTTEVTGNCSYSPFPIGPDGPGPMRANFGPELDTTQDWDWTDLDGWAARLETNGIGCNLAPLVGHSAVRTAVGLGVDREPTADELASMVRLVGASVEQGAFGLSTGLTLTPSSFATTDEIVALAGALRPYPSAFYATHARVWAGEHVHALEEAADIGRRAGVPVQFSHIAIIDKRAYGRTGDLTDVIDGARARGQDMTADVYPYTAGGTHLMQFLPEWVQDGGLEPMLGRLRDRGERARVRESAALGWFRGLPWDWDTLVISDIETEANRALVGRSIADAAGIRGEDPLDTFLALIDEEDNRVDGRLPQPDRGGHAGVPAPPVDHDRVGRNSHRARRPARASAAAAPALLRDVPADPGALRPRRGGARPRGRDPQDDGLPGRAAGADAIGAGSPRAAPRTSCCSIRRRSSTGPRSRRRTSSRRASTGSWSTA